MSVYRVKTTYFYFVISCAITVVSAMAAFQSPTAQRLLDNKKMNMAIIINVIILLLIKYKPGFGKKQIAWMVLTSLAGAILSPYCVLGPILIRAGFYTAGIVGGLFAVAVCTPSKMRLHFPLAMVCFVASMFLPMNIAFKAFILWVNTLRIIDQAERYPMYPEPGVVRPYDPINKALTIYLDTYLKYFHSSCYYFSRRWKPTQINIIN